ncbi:MAG: F0F1 ATP synthase subunit B [Candidatus Gastranaerophilales bacterium]|nr:F0F1 ATP synthase subunit B [Candidatus Gastranaerophilales bacterium]
MEFNATFIISAVSFIIFTLIMNWIFYKPVKKIMDERKAYIDDNYNEANSVKEKTQALLDDKNEKIVGAQKNSRKLVSDGVEQSKKNKENLIQNATKTSKDKIQEAKANLSTEKEQASNELKNSVYDLSKNVAEKILGKNVDNFEYDENLVNEAMKNA